MSWKSKYIPPDATLRQGRPEAPASACFFGHIRPINLLNVIPDGTQGITFAILGFKSDEGAIREKARPGAFDGPKAIRERLAGLPLQNTQIHIFDVGDIICDNHDLLKAQKALDEVITLLQLNNIRPIVLGGGHELAWSQYQGITRAFPNKRLGIINFDAHLDLHPINNNDEGKSSTAFYQIATMCEETNQHFDYNCIGIQHAGNIKQQFELAKQFNTRIILADEMHQGLQEKCFDFVDRVIDQNDHIYLSIALDVFSPAFAPGVGAIQPLGLSPWQIIPLIRQIAASNKVTSYDIAGMIPKYDIDHRTAKLAATLVYEIVHHHNEHQNIR